MLCFRDCRAEFSADLDSNDENYPGVLTMLGSQLGPVNMPVMAIVPVALARMEYVPPVVIVPLQTLSVMSAVPAKA